MKRNMKQWVADMIAAPVKQPMPILSFPSSQLMGVTVKELVSDSSLQAQGMKLVADRVPSSASVSLMDLSVEAEAFGAQIHISEDEVPTVIGELVTDEDEADALAVPEVGTARTGLYIESIAKAVELITDRPVFAGVIGPYSLAGRINGVSDVMINCYAEPDMVHTILKKATEFLINYCKAYEAAGANGIVIAEPLAGLLSPGLAEEFSHPYVKEIIDAVQNDSFVVIYHNCGNNVPLMVDEIYKVGAVGYHFGDAIQLSKVVDACPKDAMIMGNVSPSAEFLEGTPESMKEAVFKVMGECTYTPNYIVSSGCDIPPLASWDNIDAFFKAAEEFYK